MLSIVRKLRYFLSPFLNPGLTNNNIFWCWREATAMGGEARTRVQPSD